MRPVPVTEAEYELLDALWRLGPLTPTRLIAEVQARRQWAGTTIKTLLARLMRKGAITTEKDEGLLRYQPAFERQSYVESQVQALIDRLFDGDPGALSAYLASEGW